MAKIAIIGGGVIGSSIACHLALAGHAADVVVIEPDPAYEFAATPRATGGIRQFVNGGDKVGHWGGVKSGRRRHLAAFGPAAPCGFGRAPERPGHLLTAEGNALPPDIFDIIVRDHLKAVALLHEAGA